MNDRKTKKPMVEVVRRATPLAVPVTPSRPASPEAEVGPDAPPAPPEAEPARPVAPRPIPRSAAAAPRPNPSAPVAPRPVSPAAAGAAPVAPRPVTPPGAPVAPRVVTPAPRGPGAPGAFPRPSFGARSGPPGRSFPPRAPRPPPTHEEVLVLAKRERVPARIAKGDLEGKMKCRIWRKLHAEEARRFDQAYVLLEKHPNIDLQDAFGVIQSGMTVDEFLARKARTQKRTQIKEARTAAPNEQIDAYVQRCIDDKRELAVVLGERSLYDVLVGVGRVSFTFEKAGELEKLNVVMLASRSEWERVQNLERDPKLSVKPAGVPRQPDQRPVSDPRVFSPHVGGTISLTLRNGIRLTEPLRAAGAYDLLLGKGSEELFVPLHAISRWETPPSSP